MSKEAHRRPDGPGCPPRRCSRRAGWRERPLCDADQADAPLRGNRARATRSISSCDSVALGRRRARRSPQCGQSSLLRRISNAKPKVADYPFTTIEPVLGVVDGPDARQLTVADVPGLIERAAKVPDSGTEFLAHLERAQLLLHVLDASEPDLEGGFASRSGALGVRLGSRRAPPARRVEQDRPARRAARVLGGLTIESFESSGRRARPVPGSTSLERALELCPVQPRGGAGSARPGIPRVSTAAKARTELDPPHGPRVPRRR